MKSGDVKTVNADGFAKYAEETVEGIKSFYMQEAKLKNESNDVKEAPCLKETLHVLKGVRKFNEENVCKLVFFYLATDDKPFHNEMSQR